MGRLGELARVFLKLGLIAFGGPAAHIAMMEEEFVVRRKWIGPQHFLDLIGATNLIPGPNSTEMTMHVGYERAGWPGLVVAGGAFIFPAVLITAGLAWLYVEYGALPEVAPLLFGIKPAVIAVILGAVWRLGKTAVKGWRLGVLGLSITAAVLGFAHTLGEFGVVLMIGGNIPGVTQVVSIAIYDHVEALEYGHAHVLAGGLLLFSFLILAAVYGLNRKYGMGRL